MPYYQKLEEQLFTAFALITENKFQHLGVEISITCLVKLINFAESMCIDCIYINIFS